jgi:hypothetical protein
VPGAAVASVAGLALLTGGAVWRLGLAALGYVPAGFGFRPVQAAVDVVVALIITRVLPRQASTRAWALALLLPAGLVVRLLVDLVSARLGLPI